jgi:HlyD family secretion protein
MLYTIKKWLKKLGARGLFVVGLLVGLVLGLWVYSGSGIPKGEVIEVTKSTLTQQVNVTGQIEPEQSVDLSFETTGKVISLGADVGDNVVAGQSLVSLDGAELRAQLASAQAGAAAQTARLAELERGTRPEELAITEAAAADATTALINALTDAYAKSDDAVRNKIDAYFLNPRTINADVDFPITDTNLQIALHDGRIAVERNLVAWQSEPPTTNTTSVEQRLNAIKQFLDQFALAINNVPVNTTTSRGVSLSTARIDTAAARSAINTALTNLISAKNSYNSAQTELRLKRAGSSTESIQAAQAEVDQAQAQVALLQAQVAKTTLRAPFAGVVLRQDAKLGQSVSANLSLVSLMASSGLKITAKVPEVNIGKVLVGNPVTIHLDAFPTATFTGTVSRIDPAETILDGVVNYEITVTFDAEDARLRSGLTANLDIVTQNKEALAVPQAAIFEKDGQSYVYQAVGNRATATKVSTGINSQDGLIEIVSGLEAGNKVYVIE